MKIDPTLLVINKKDCQKAVEALGKRLGFDVKNPSDGELLFNLLRESVFDDLNGEIEIKVT